MSDDLNQPLEVTDAPDPMEAKPADAKTGMVEVPYPALSDYFNVETLTDKEREFFGDIWEFFADDAESVGEMMYKMRQLENRLGSPEVGESRLVKMHKYIKVSKQIESGEQERDSLLRR